ncbi:MAG: hypothetical protein ACREKH_20530 [Candidatus Rokuibacteriota bacterium]
MEPERRGKRTEGERARAAALWGAGVPRHEILEVIGIDRRTLWEWRTTDPEFQRIARETAELGVAEAVIRLRALAPNVVEAFERGLASTHRQQAMKLKELSIDDGDLAAERVKIVELADNSLAVQTATKVSERIPELMPRKGVEVDLDLSERVAAWIRRMDGDDDSGDHAGAPEPLPPGPTPIRPDQSLDPDQAGA